MNSRIKIQRRVAKTAKLLKQASQELAEARGEALVIKETNTYRQLTALQDLVQAMYGAALSGPYQ